MVTTVLFDLDGTLVDTAPDLGHALNLQLEKHNKPKLSDAVIRPVASHGSRGLLNLGFGLAPDDDEFIQMRDEYLDIYEAVITRSPMLFTGMQSALNMIVARSLSWGIVTNKPARFTVPLVKSLNLYSQAACVVSGDDAPHPKPSPETLFLACKHAQVKPENCIYVGDAERDIQAGQAAGMKTIAALYGYIGTNDKPEAWGADHLIHAPEEILKLI